MTSKGRLAERSEATRAALVAAARDRFSAQGFASTSIEDIVQHAGMTRGALYHHFEGKQELFRAVYEQLEAELAQRSLTAATQGSDPLDALRLGIEAFLDACLEPEIQRIVLLDGLSVLGWEAWHDIGTRFSFGLLRAGVEAAMQQGQIVPGPSEPLAHLLQGALVRAGLVVARADNPAASRHDMGGEVARLVAGLAVNRPQS